MFIFRINTNCLLMFLHIRLICAPIKFTSLLTLLSYLLFKPFQCFVRRNSVSFTRSAKVTEENEVTPQSNYIAIHDHGQCQWAPRYEFSVTHCPVDVTWFPFDEQTCDLVFESWSLYEYGLEIIADNKSVVMYDLVQPKGWYLIGSCPTRYLSPFF